MVYIRRFLVANAFLSQSLYWMVKATQLIDQGAPDFEIFMRQAGVLMALVMVVYALFGGFERK